MNTHRGCFCVRFFLNYPAKKLDYSRAHNEEQIIEIHENTCFYLRKTIGNEFFHIGAKSARINFRFWGYLRRRLVNAWLKFKIAAWRSLWHFKQQQQQQQLSFETSEYRV